MPDYECPFCHTGFTNPDDYAKCVTMCNNKRKINAEAALRAEMAKKTATERAEKAKRIETERAEIMKARSDVAKRIKDFNDKYLEEFPIAPIPYLGSYPVSLDNYVPTVSLSDIIGGFIKR